jgi:hypothetical protein
VDGFGGHDASRIGPSADLRMRAAGSIEEDAPLAGNREDLLVGKVVLYQEYA